MTEHQSRPSKWITKREKCPSTGIRNWSKTTAILSMAIFCILGSSSAAYAAAVILAQKTATLLVDADGNGYASPGDTLEYTVTISNPGDQPASNVIYTDNIDPNTTLVDGSVIHSPVAVPDTYPEHVIGNVSINSSLINFSVFSNDNPGSPAVTEITSYEATSLNGGNVTMVTTGEEIGEFTYDPPAGFEGVDTFKYTLTNAAGSAEGIVSLTVEKMIWFVNNTAAPCTALADGCGRLSKPFSTLASLTSINSGTGNAPAGGDTIFIYESATSYSSPMVLLSGQILVGQDATASLATLASVTPGLSSAALPAMNTGGPNATLSNSVTLNTNTVVRGLTLNTSTNSGLIDPAASISNVSVSEISITTTTGTAVNLSNIAGTLSIKSINVNGAVNGVNLSNHTGSFTISGTGGAGSGGTISNTSSDAIRLENAQNVSIAYLNINSPASARTNSACNYSSVSSLCEAGVEIINSSNITLDDLVINAFNAGMVGIAGNAVSNLTITDSQVLNIGDYDNESAILLQNLNGTNLLEDLIVDNPEEFGVRIFQTTGNPIITLRRLIVRNSMNNSYGEDGLSIRVEGGSTTILVDGSTFLNTGGSGIAASAEGGGGTTLNLTVNNSTFTENRQLPHAIAFSTGLNATGRLTLSGANPMYGCQVATNCAGAIDLDASDNSVLDATITGVTSTNSGQGTGLEFIVNDNASGKAQVTNNSFTMAADRLGMNFQARSVLTQSSPGRLDITTTNNTIYTSGSTSNLGMTFQSGGSSGTHAQTMCVDASGNTVNGINNPAYTLRQRAGTAFILPNVSDGTNPASVETYFKNRNSGGSLAGGTYVYPAGGSTIVNYQSGSCSLPVAATPVAVLMGGEEMAGTHSNNVSAAPSAASTGKSLASAVKMSTSGWVELQRDSEIDASTIRPEILKAAITPINIGTLPAGQTVTIKYQVTINNPLVPSNALQVTNQGTVTSNLGEAKTDDPAISGAENPTIVRLPKPDLIAEITNSISGVTNLPTGWNWSIRVTNQGDAEAIFIPDQVVLTDQLPDLGAAYGIPLVSDSADLTGTLDCQIILNDLTCKANGEVEIAPDGYFVVSFDVVPSTGGIHANPRSGASCKANPMEALIESDYTNNACSDSVTVNEPPAFTSANSATFTINASGTFDVTTSPGYPIDIEITSVGTLPNGLSFSDNGDGTAVINGIPTESGEFELSITASNGILPDAVQTFTLVVNEAPSIISGDHTLFLIGSTASFTITTSGHPYPGITFVSTPALPPSISITDQGDGTAVLTGTAGVSDLGAYEITITANNGIDPEDTQAFTLTIGSSPSITSQDNTIFVAGTDGTFEVTTSGYPVPAISQTGVLPAGVSYSDLGTGTGRISGKPSDGTGGVYLVDLIAANGLDPVATQSFTITVNESPEFTSSGSASFTTGTSGTVQITTDGYPAATITYTSEPSLPASLSLVDNLDGTATLSGTPLIGDGGAYSIHLSASNGVGADATQILTLTIGQPPELEIASPLTFEVGVHAAWMISSTGYPIPTISITGTLPNGLTFTDNLDGTSTVQGTSQNGSGGEYSLSAQAANGVLPDDSENFEIVVNESPTFISTDNTTFISGSSGSFNIRTEGYPDAVISYTSEPALPSSLTVVDGGDGTATLQGTPLTGQDGTYTIQLTASNGIGLPAQQTFMLTVGQAPEITSLSVVHMIVGRSNTFLVTTTGTPKPEITFTGELPAGVTLTDNEDGTATLSGNPGQDAIGTYPIQLHASNGIGSNASQNLNIWIDPALTVQTVDTVPDTGDGQLEEDEHTSVGITQFLVDFNKPLDLTSAETTANYGLIMNGVLPIEINSATYSALDNSVQLMVNDGNPLLAGSYSLITRGEIMDVSAFPLGSDFTLNFVVDTSSIQIGSNGIRLADGTILIDGITLNKTFSFLNIAFSEDAYNPPGDDDPDDVTNPANYLLLRPGPNNQFDTQGCVNGVVQDDLQVVTGPVYYIKDDAHHQYVASLGLNDGIELENGTYRLLICGTTSITDIAGNPLNGGSDVVTTFSLMRSSEIRTNPATGFAPGVETSIPSYPVGAPYHSLGDLWLEIPAQNVRAAITGVPLKSQGWDLTWLRNQIGWLEGTAAPTWTGNTVLTAHAYTADGAPGPFVALKNLKYGDSVVIHSGGYVYTYQVKTKALVSANNTSLLTKHEDQDWVSLVTCQTYDEATASYKYRVVVRAILVTVEEE